MSQDYIRRRGQLGRPTLLLTWAPNFWQLVDRPPALNS